jgi:hypothetical protein
MMYSPVPLLRVVWVTLVSVFVKPIEARGITAPVVSLTVPLIEAAERCAKLALGKATSSTNPVISAIVSETTPLKGSNGADGHFMNHLLFCQVEIRPKLVTEEKRTF